MASGNLSTRIARAPLARYASKIVRLADENHATVGYAGYWDASNLTWNVNLRVAVRPVMQCPNPTGAGMCPFFLERVPSWYVIQRRRSFLLVDPSDQFLASLPLGLGRPSARYTLGSLRMYVYPYDIASRLGPPPD